ncbi:hypothetical protein XENTR_v10023128 [Xenopus tropicalis]|nr:hypothetical protein XENTR_v10023128 [Xenopus tropicalis]
MSKLKQEGAGPSLSQGGQLVHENREKAEILNCDFSFICATEEPANEGCIFNSPNSRNITNDARVPQGGFKERVEHVKVNKSPRPDRVGFSALNKLRCHGAERLANC